MNESKDPSIQCGKAAETEMLLSRKLFGEALSATEQSTLDSHLTACAHCRALHDDVQKTNQILEDELFKARAPRSLMPRVLAKLPQTVPGQTTTNPATSDGSLRVVSVSAKRSTSWWIPLVSAAAAAVAVVVGLSFVRNDGAPVAKVERGSLRDSSGRIVKELRAGEMYTAEKETIVPLHADATLRLSEGAHFAVQPAMQGMTPGLTLQRGDMYTWGRSSEQSTRVACDTFEAQLQKGDFFVSEDDTHDPRGVLIVFNGNAVIGAEGDADTLNIPGGHVFVSVKDAHDPFTELLTMADVFERMQQDISIQGLQTTSLREEYARKVSGYDKELKDLALAVEKESDTAKRSELQEREARVKEYRAQHHKRLKTMRSEFPTEQIRRGLDQHIEPERWM